MTDWSLRGHSDSNLKCKFKIDNNAVVHRSSLVKLTKTRVHDKLMGGNRACGAKKIGASPRIRHLMPGREHEFQFRMPLLIMQTFWVFKNCTDVLRKTRIRLARQD